MPSKSRKKIKGQARKAKAKAAAAATTAKDNESTFLPNGTSLITTPLNSICNHGDCTDDDTEVCGNFIKTFFTFLLSPDKGLGSRESMVNTVVAALSTTYNKFPEAVNKEDYRQIVKKNIICNGTSYLVKFFAKQSPCNCLDDLYCELRSTTPKTAACPGCRQTKERKSMFMCTGCDRMQYCSKACQIAHVPKHKEDCKFWQSYDSKVGELSG